MGTATTFAELIANAQSEKVFLAELKLAQFPQNWLPPTSYGITVEDAVCHISHEATNSFFWIEGVDLSTYAGTEGSDTPYRVIITDPNGYKLIAYCGAAGGGEALTGETSPNNTAVSDSQVEANSSTGWWGNKEISSSSPNVGSYHLRFPPYGALTLIYSNGEVPTSGRLKKVAFDIKVVTGGAYAQITKGGSTLLDSATYTNAAYQSKIVYYTQDNSPYNYVSWKNTTTDGEFFIDNVSYQHLTDCPATGLHLISTRNGSTHSVESIDANFNPNAATFTVSIDTSIYSVNFLNETVTLPDGSTEVIRKEIAAVEENGTALTVKTSVAEVAAAASSYYHDTANGILYVHTSGGDSPDNYSILAYFWLYFATKGIVLNSKYYEPYIAQNGIPSLSQGVADIHWGTSQISSGAVIFNNGRGFFDQIARNFIWHNKQIKILLGGDSLPYSEYTAIFTGRIVDPTFTKQEFSLSLRSNSFDLLRTLPINDFWTSTWANLDPAAEGKPIPYYWGSYSAAQAPIVTCINTAYAASTYQFKICDTTFHAIKSITQVYVDYGDGVGWQTIAHANEDLTNATFTINTASFVVGTSRVKVAFEGYHSGGTLIEGAPEIAEDILLNQCGYAAADLDSTSFTTSKSISACSLNVPIESQTDALTIIETICKSDLAFFDENGSGQLRYRTWEPAATGTISELTALDFLSNETPTVIDDTTKLFWRVKVGYSYLCEKQSYLYAESTDTESKYKYSKSETLTHETYLRSSSAAETLAQRLNWVTRAPSPSLSVALKTPQISALLGDKVKVTLARAPYGTSGGYDARVFEIINKDISCFPVTMKLTGRDLMDFGNNVGFWTAASAPDYTSATEQEKEDSGYWTDDYGLADPTDQASKNKSLWW